MGKILAYVIPILIFLVILYANFLPFGYSDTRVIDVGTRGDTTGVFFLEEGEFLGSREEEESKITYRQVDGLTYALYTPGIILRNMEGYVSLDAENLSLSQKPSIDFNWDFEWQGKDFFTYFDVYRIKAEGELEKTNLRPSSLNNCTSFNGLTRLDLPRTQNRFEEGPFAIYVEWIPQNNAEHQQIVGRFNWEIYQNKRDVSFTIGRATDGNRYSVSYDIDNNFFNQKNSLLALYNPAKSENEIGYIELFVNGFSTGKEYIYEAQIDKDYGNQNLTLGWTSHSGGERPGFVGEICDLRFSYIELEGEKVQEAYFDTKIAQTIRIPIIGEGILRKVEFKIEK